ncbi:hypothetical protein J4E91_010741 [Alternaria rosae]|nr:hypothetical protein J4E91_010741 [Alternaria rosae]
MSDAISNLGGGGLSTPWLANLANSLSYAMSFISTILGGPIINRIGIKWATAAITIPSVVIFGKLLDSQRWPQRPKAWAAFLLWILPQTGCFIWVAFEYHYLGDRSALDYESESGRWARAYVPYLIIFVSGYWTQLTLYWILGTFSNDMGDSSRVGGLFRAFETAGQAVSYGLSSASSIAPVVPIYVNCGLLVLTVPSMVMLITKMPRRPLSNVTTE